MDSPKQAEGDELAKNISFDDSAANVLVSHRIRQKADIVLLPLLGFCYLLQFLDKQTLSYASLLGMPQDIGLSGEQFSWAASIFYLGFIFWSFPTMYLAVRLPIGKYISITVIVWAAVLMCHAACENFAGLMTTRFFLGAFEASIAPGFSLITGVWYTRQEQPFRYGLWYCGAGFATLFGGLASYGIGHIDASLPAWRYLFLIFGAVTAAWGFVMLLLLPDTPARAIWLTKTEREVSGLRVASETRGHGLSGPPKWYQAFEAFRDPAVWLLSLYTFCVNIANGGLTAFGSLVIEGFGYEGLQALLIQMPAGAAQLGFILVASCLCSRIPNIRLFTMETLTSISLVGMALMYALDSANQAGRMAGFCLSLAFSANMPLALSLITSNMGGFTKRATANACILIMYCVGNIAGPQFFSVAEAPDYPQGIKASLAGFCLGLFFLICLHAYLVWQNRKRNQQGAELTARREVMLLQDKTDWELEEWRYVL